ELLRRGFHVTLVSLFHAQETIDLGLRFVHPRLEQHRFEDFDLSELATRVGRGGLVLVEAPARLLVEVARRARSEGWQVVYDVIDDWSDPALGGDWFDPESERELVSLADHLIASAPDLVARVERLGRVAILVPNAVNQEIFGVEMPPRPSDLPEAGTLIGYHGSLYGDWFDWEALAAVAEAFPAAAVVVIGDDKAPHPSMPPNVVFLGLKPQTELPGYLQRLDVGLIPFKVTETTHAVSPLKVYEYLASGVPVAAPPLRSLDDLEGVATHSDLATALERALAASPPRRTEALAAHSWEARVDQIVKPIWPSHVDARAESCRIVMRPAKHFGRGSRLGIR
ncbi:MAG: glycosyltransferase, partial [Actinobacteria bacterium]|nr:glycosyltransferase [Actinomycetota bacterium]